MRALLPILAALTAASAAAQEASLTRTYHCDAGAVLRVAYLNPDPDTSLAVVDYAGHLVPMRAGPTGSGVRYQAIDTASGLIWHSKGNDGFLARDSGSGQETLLDNCRAIGN
jgi:membrane-bound inhibitor of C-type lysozyme